MIRRKLISILLTAVMAVSVLPTVAFGADAQAKDAAQTLHSLGLFKGTGTNPDGTPIYALDRAPTRHEAVTMLVNLLGKGEQAMSGTWDIPFHDVAEWAKPFVGYAYAHGLTAGISADTFGGEEQVSAAQYITFLLKVLGYEAGTDFQWDRSWELSDAIGLTDGSYSGTDEAFTRGDVAILSLNAYLHQQAISNAPCFGVSEEIRFVLYPTNDEQLKNNILYSFLVGNYTARLILPESRFYLPVAMIRDLIHLRPELMGMYSNIKRTGLADHLSIPGRSVSHIVSTENAALSPEEIYARQLAGLEEAKRVRAQLYDSGAIQEGMTQLQIAQAYIDYLLELEVEPAIGRTDPICSQYDCVYAVLIERKADCIGRTAAFNTLMNLEGIPVQGVVGSYHKPTPDHIMSRVVLDGEEYFSDWANGRALGSIRTYEDEYGFAFDANSLAQARAQQ